MNTILVTGSAGFMGRVLTRRLEEAGYRVLQFDQDQGDISQPGALGIFAEESPGHVFHLAGRTFVPESWRNPFGFFQVNVMGTANVLEFCRQTGARLTFVSSYVYGEPEYLPIDEVHPVKSYNPYSQSKLMAESACFFYAEHFKVPVTIIRPFNAYGPGQPKQFLISEIISKVLDPQVPVIEVMDLRPRRDYVHVEDIVRALVLSVNAPAGVYNIGSGYSKSVEEIIGLVLEMTGVRKAYRSLSVPRPNEIMDLYADIRKAGRDLGWQPAVLFSDGIEACIRSNTASK